MINYTVIRPIPLLQRTRKSRIL